MPALEKYLNNQKRLWGITASKGGDMITASGWNSSVDRKPFSQKEMCEFVNNVVIKLAPYLDSHASSVLEIGVGSGLILRGIAPRVKMFDAVDISQEILTACLNFNNSYCSNVRLFQLFAHEINGLDEKYNIIILNSVMQYFADMEFVRDVLNKCKNMLHPDGIIFCGDIMDSNKKTEMIEYVKTGGIEQHNFDKLLFFSRSFFSDIANELSLVRCETSDKIYTLANEMSLFRYDAMLFL